MTKEGIERLIKSIEAFRLELCKANEGLHGEECSGCPSSAICDSTCSVWAKLMRARAVKDSGKAYPLRGDDVFIEGAES